MGSILEGSVKSEQKGPVCETGPKILAGNRLSSPCIGAANTLHKERVVSVSNERL
jgi:hypothetical protein